LLIAFTWHVFAILASSMLVSAAARRPAPGLESGT
jgi:hypothetical protein